MHEIEVRKEMQLFDTLPFSDSGYSLESSLSLIVFIIADNYTNRVKLVSY